MTRFPVLLCKETLCFPSFPGTACDTHSVAIYYQDYYFPSGEESSQLEGQLSELVTEAELDEAVRLLYLDRDGRNVATGMGALVSAISLYWPGLLSALTA